MIRNNLHGGSSGRFSVTHVNLLLFALIRKVFQPEREEVEKEEERGQAEEGELHSKHNRAFQQSMLSEMKVCRRDFSRINACDNFDRNRLWPLHLLSEEETPITIIKQYLIFLLRCKPRPDHTTCSRLNIDDMRQTKSMRIMNKALKLHI